MQYQTAWFYKIFLFLAVFSCLPLPHGNTYPFIIMVLGCFVHHRKSPQRLVIPHNLALISFFVWSGMSVLWSVDSLQALGMFGKNMVIIGSGWIWWKRYCCLETQEQQKKSVFLASLMLGICLVIFAVNQKFGGELYKIINQNLSQALIHGCVACALSIWIGLKEFNKWLQAFVLILLIWTIQACSSDTAALGVFLGAVTLAAYKVFPSILRVVFVYGMPIVWLILPFVFRLLNPAQFQQWAIYLDNSYTHRLFIWHSVSEQIFNRFWTGFGIGSSRLRSAFSGGVDIIFNKGGEKVVFTAPENCLHPHNFMLQIWLELGSVGVIFACLAWIIYWRKAYEKSDSYVIAFWGSALCVAATGISIWQSWWLILIVTLLPVYSRKKVYDKMNF